MNQEFEIFVNNFDMNEKSIERKYSHSLRVQKINEQLAKKKNLNEDLIELASLIGLLHDYGRFYQWTKYKSFDDYTTIDHADYAAKELIEKKEISKFYKIKDNYRVIYEAIKYHNKYEIPTNVENRMMCEMIRDADKLDLLYMYAIGDFKITDNEEISDNVKKQFFNHELIAYKNRKTKTDVFINGLSFIFDLYLKESLIYLKENNLIDKIKSHIKEKEKMKTYFNEIERYIEEKLREED